MKTYQELREAGTPGEWRPVLINKEHINIAPTSVQVSCHEDYRRALADAQLIAHEHNVMPKLIVALSLMLDKSMVSVETMVACRKALTAATTIEVGSE